MIDCIEWEGERSERGYGVIRLSGRKSIRAHRWVVEQREGRTLLPSEKVLHSCDNPPCVNYDHLIVGTQAQNMADMKAKGRQSRGEGRLSAKLTEKQVRKIRKRYASGRVSQVALAREHNVYPSVISRIVSGKAWEWVR